MDAKDLKPRETWNRLVRLLITLSCEGREHEFQELIRREVHRLVSQEER